MAMFPLSRSPHTDYTDVLGNEGCVGYWDRPAPHEGMYVDKHGMLLDGSDFDRRFTVGTQVQLYTSSPGRLPIWKSYERSYPSGLVYERLWFQDKDKFIPYALRFNTGRSAYSLLNNQAVAYIHAGLINSTLTAHDPLVTAVGDMPMDTTLFNLDFLMSTMRNYPLIGKVSQNRLSSKDTQDHIHASLSTMANSSFEERVGQDPRIMTNMFYPSEIPPYMAAKVYQGEPITRRQIADNMDTNMPTIDVSRAAPIVPPDGPCVTMPDNITYAMQHLDPIVATDYDVVFEAFLVAGKVQMVAQNHLIYRYLPNPDIAQSVVLADRMYLSNAAQEALVFLKIEQTDIRPYDLDVKADPIYIRITKNNLDEGLITYQNTPDPKSAFLSIYLDFAVASLCSLGLVFGSDFLDSWHV